MAQNAPVSFERIVKQVMAKAAVETKVAAKTDQE
jgi:hypothetical protein